MLISLMKKEFKIFIDYYIIVKDEKAIKILVGQTTVLCIFIKWVHKSEGEAKKII